MTGIGAVWRWLEAPPRLLHTRSARRRPGARLLDVGCGNHSPALTKRYYPRCVYHGLDSGRWNRDDADDPLQPRARARERSLHGGGQARGEARARRRALRRGAVGAQPRPPAGREGWFGIKGVLNFYDDETHRGMVDLPRLRAALEERGFRVSPPGYRRLWRRCLLLPAYAFADLVLHGYVPASVVWDVTGFAQYLVARKAA